MKWTKERVVAIEAMQTVARDILAKNYIELTKKDIESLRDSVELITKFYIMSESDEDY